MVFNMGRLEKYADSLLWGLTTARPGFKKGDVVLIRAGAAAMPLAEALQERMLDRGWNPVLRTDPNPAWEKSFYGRTVKEQRTFIPAGEKEFFSGLNGLVALRAPESITHLADVDPKRISEAAVARKPLREILDRREERGLFGWTLCLYPTLQPARAAKMGFSEYARQIEKACFLDEKDPVARWREIHREVAQIKGRLDSLGACVMRLESRSMDLEVRVGERRRWLGISGRNVPSFEVFTSPDWRGARGVYFADLPSYRSGNYIEALRVEFKDGRAVKVTARQGEAFARRMTSMDSGACRIGELSLTDRRFSRIDRFMAETLYDENFGGRYGNSHIALGASYSDAFSGDQTKLTKAMRESLGFNDSSLHWDIINTEDKRVTARVSGGRTVAVYEDGRFVV
ncbi:MAG: aminopeptidase [Elusimicrobia bacterium]|nr:aminopeptidase [Elusimicrobiota bacterium]